MTTMKIPGKASFIAEDMCGYVPTGNPNVPGEQVYRHIEGCKCKRLEALQELQEESEKLGLYEHKIPEHKHPAPTKIDVLDKGFVRLVDHMGSDSAIVQKARVSYGAGTKKVSEDEGLIRYLIRNKHTSPLEGVIFKFHIKAPIFVFRQWHRHRMWSYNEMSGRYSEMPDEFYVPAEDKVTTQNPDNKQGGTNDLVPFDRSAVNNELEYAYNLETESSKEDWPGLFSSEQEEARYAYEYFLKTGMRKELARINLPLAQYSEMYATVDLHNLFHFLKLRQDGHAQYEIRVYADALLELIRPIVPIAVQAYEDYILNSLSFSHKELACLKELLLNDNNFNGFTTAAKTLLTNKRESEEFTKKIEKIISLG